MNIEDIKGRRSVSPRWLEQPGPDESQLHAIISAACCAADHRKLQPFRFIRIDDHGRSDLSDLFVEAAHETHGDMTAAQETRASEKALHGATLVALVACIRLDAPDVPQYEQWIAVGAALQNVLLAAHALNFAAMMVSGDKVATKALSRGLNLAQGEQLVGFIAIGTAAKTPKPRPEEDPNSVLSHWPSDEGLAA